MYAQSHAVHWTQEYEQEEGLYTMINNIAIKRVSNVKFLGVIIDEHLTWKSHINLVKNKAAKMIGIIKKA